MIYMPLCALFSVFYFIKAQISATETRVNLGCFGALLVAFLVWIRGFSLEGTYGYAKNPTRDLGPGRMHTIIHTRNKASSNWASAQMPVF